MKKAWWALGVVCMLACSGGGEPLSESTTEALTVCRGVSLTGNVTSAGVTPGNWQQGAPILAQVPTYVVVSSNMPTGTPSFPTTHYLSLGASRSDGSFRADVTCSYSGKYLSGLQYRSDLVGCTVPTQGRVYSFSRAQILTSSSTLPASSGVTWSATATLSELNDDDDPCTTDVCNASTGATHTFNGSAPGCARPNPITPPTDASLTSNTARDAADLFSHQGGTAGALDVRRAAIVRGTVYETNGAGAAVLASSVNVSVLGHPELGSTTSASDGTYALAVNGGGVTMLRFQKSGTLGAQRNVELSWHDFRKAPDVQLVSHNDGAGTVIPAGGSGPVRGVSVTDSRGTRRATMWIPPGTTSNVAGAWTMHVTEFTTGPEGPTRMPAPLPANSGYTYAFAADIEQANGAPVTFSQPVPFYVDNFLNFIVGQKAPVGSFDETAGVWKAEPSGVVLKILSVVGGVAKVDVDGNGAEDVVGSAPMVAQGITSQELAALGALYSSGKTLVRVRLSHLTKWDVNWGLVPPSGARSPDVPAPEASDATSCPTTVTGSIIECENRTLAEEIPVTGTPYKLRFQSARTRGLKSTVRIPLTGSTYFPVQGAPTRVDWVVNVAGREFKGSTPTVVPSQAITFTWDGIDGFGRAVTGRVPMDIAVGNVYSGVYATTSEFGYSGLGSAISGDPASGELTFWKSDQVLVGAYDAANLGLGGWTLSPHHVFEPEQGDVYQGDGTTLRIDNTPHMEWIGGDPNLPETDGVPITQTSLGTGPNGLTAIAADPDGSVWMAQGGYNTQPSDYASIRRMRPDGIVERATGNAPQADATDGGLAANARLYGAFVRVGPDGDLYVVDFHANRVWRVTNESPRRTRLFAGNGTTCTGNGCGDGSLAKTSPVNAPLGIAFDSAGNAYIAEYGPQGRIRKVDPKGKISTVIDTSTPAMVEVDGNGSLYFQASQGALYKLALSATAGTTPTTVASNPFQDVCSGPELFLDSSKHPGFACYQSLHIAADGAATAFRRVAGVGSYISDLLGPESYGDGRAALHASFSGINHGLAAVAFDGSIILADSGVRLRRVRKKAALPTGNYLVPSGAGELFEFDAAGKHLRTKSELTGVVKTQFAYDASGRISSITDENGLVTQILRPLGNPNQVQILAPKGQATVLTLDASSKLLSGVQVQAGLQGAQTYSFTMDSATGQLRQMTDPRSGAHVFEYDPTGRLDRDQDAVSYSQYVSEVPLSNGRSVTAKSAAGLVTTYNITHQADANAVSIERRMVTTPRNTTTTTDTGADDRSVRTEPSGMTLTTLRKPDPRYGMYSPAYLSDEASPGGKRHFTSESVSVTLATPSDPTSVQNETRTTDENPASCGSGSSCAPMNQSQVVFDRAAMTRTRTSAAGRVVVETLDAKERVVRTQVSGVGPVDYTYDGEGRVSQILQGSRLTTYTYGADGLVSSVTAGGSTLSYTTRDSMGRPGVVTLPGGAQVNYAYDAAGNVTSVTPPGQAAHAQGFDLRNLMNSFTEPTVSATTLAYNADRQLTTTMFPGLYGSKTATYNQGLYSGVTVSSGGYGRTVTRDSAERISTITTGLSDNVTLGFGYDGRLLTSVQWNGAVSGTVAYGYDHHFVQNQISIAGTNVIRTFDADDLLTSMVLGVAGSPTISINRDAQLGRVTGVTLCTPLCATTETRSYDSTYGELSGLQYTLSSANIYNVSYLRDSLGRVTSKTETVGAGAPLTVTYGYDAAGHLASETRGAATTTWGYDANGNRTTLNGVTVGSYNTQDALLSYNGVSYTYRSATGELLTRGTTSYTWDLLGNLRTVAPSGGSTVGYLYDGQERRVAKQVAGVTTKRWLYDGQLRVVAEIDSAGTKRFIYGSHEHVPDVMIDASGVYRYVTDQLGSVRAVVNLSTNTVVSQMDYDAWGNVLAGATNPTLQPFRFAGGLYDTDTGFVHFGARDYDPATGRWLSKDAARWTGGYNFYGYVNGDPVNYIDVNGRNPFAVALGIGVTVGETVAASVAVAVTWDVLFNKAKGTKAIVKAVEKAIDKCKPGPQPDFCSLEDGDGRCNADKTIWCQYRCASGGTKSEYQYQTDCAPGKVLNWRVRCEQTVVGP